MITDETFEFWLYKASQYDVDTHSFVGEPLAKATTDSGIAVFLENNGTPEYKDDDFVLDPEEDYVVWEVPKEGWIYGPQGSFMPVKIVDSVPTVFDENKFYNTKKQEEQFGKISGHKYQRIVKSSCWCPTYIDVPKQGYHIYLFDAAGNLVAETVTDKNGYFEFDKLPLGKYKVVEPTNEYWQAVTGYKPEVKVTLTGEKPEYNCVKFKNTLKNVCTDTFCGYNKCAKKVYNGCFDSSWYTYVTLAANKKSETFNLQAGNPGAFGKGGKTVGTFTATIDGDYLLIKVDLNKAKYSFGLINGVPEINVGVANSTSFFAGYLKNNSNLNATQYRDKDDATLFRIPLKTMGLKTNKAINIFVNGVVVYAPEGYEIPPVLDVP